MLSSPGDKLDRTETQQKARKAKEILDRIESGEITAYTSTLTWDEVVWVVSRALGRDDGIRQVKEITRTPPNTQPNANLLRGHRLILGDMTLVSI